MSAEVLSNMIIIIILTEMELKLQQAMWCKARMDQIQKEDFKTLMLLLIWDSEVLNFPFKNYYSTARFI